MVPHFVLPPDSPAIVYSRNQEFNQNAQLYSDCFNCFTVSHTISETSSALVSQAIVPASDGVGTQVNVHGNQFDIRGGQRSGNGENLFHSFLQFGLSQEQTANFLSTPEIQNILMRVVGGTPSIINGKIQVAGGHSNLFLVNPVGILFGPTASLNVPASFMATTATAIAFRDQWLNVYGTNSYATLTGSPTGLAFMEQPGAATSMPGVLANLGHLAVPPGNQLSLIGGTVVNTGQLAAPAGQITIAAVPDSRLVKLHQVDSVLNLEIQPLEHGQPTIATSFVPITALPQLLTGSGLGHATGMSVQPNGAIHLTGSGMTLPTVPGTVLISGQVSVTNQASPVGIHASASNAGGSAAGRVIVVGNSVNLVNATIQASGTNGGGTVLIGGDFHGQGSLPTATRTYVSTNSTIQADALQSGQGGQVAIWADQTTGFYGTATARGANVASPTHSNGGFIEVSGKQNLVFRGQVDVSAPDGIPGTLLLDPTNITIQGTGSNDSELTAGIPNLGDPAGTIFAADGGAANFTLSASTLQAQVGTVILEAKNHITIAPGTSLNFAPGSGSITFTADADGDGVGTFSMDPTQTVRAPGRSLNISGATINTGNLDTSTIAAGTSTGGNVNLTASDLITTGAITTSASAIPPGTTVAIAGNVVLNAGRDLATGTITAFAISPAGPGSTATGGNVSLVANIGNVIFSSIDTRGSTAPISTGGNVSITANGLIQGTGTGTTVTTASPTQSGSITLQHTGGPANVPFVVGQPSSNGSAGVLDAGGTAIITTGSFPVPASGGSTVVTAPTSSITITSVNQPPTLTINPILAGAVQNQPVTFTYANLAPAIADANLDQTTLLVNAINSGALLVNGNPAIAGTTQLNPGDTLTYIPPANVSGAIPAAFSLIATDGVSFSAPTPVAINIQAVLPPTPEQPPTLPPLPPTPEQPPVEEPPSPGTALPDPLPQNSLQPSLTGTSLSCSATDIGVSTLDSQYAQIYEEYLGKKLRDTKTKFLDPCTAFNSISAATGVKPALVYVHFVPTKLDTPTAAEQDSDQLELIAVLPNRSPIYRHINGANRAEVRNTVRQLINAITAPISRETNDYLVPSQKLYQWLVEPLEAELNTRKVQNLSFIMDPLLQAIPIAALHNGKNFLIEKYSLGLMPGLSITDTRYHDIRDSQVLAMGSSTFTEQQPLLAVPTELAVIFRPSWAGKAFLNSEFTFDNLKFQRQQVPYGIIHLATHAEFNPNFPNQAYIQLNDRKLRLDEVRQLGWSNPPVQLLVLSACRTALGNTDAELGFAGLAYQTGVRSVLGSLWAVDDEGSLAFMTEFYRRLKIDPIKAEAVRQAQLAMLKKQVRLEQDKLITPSEIIQLPPELVRSSSKDLSYPFYWAAFTLVGNPW